MMRTNGQVDHLKTLSIPDSERIPVLAKENRRFVLTSLVAAIGSAFANLNLRIGMNDDQIIELADAIIDTSHEDFLSIEDVLLFLRDLVTGKTGKIYDRMDMPTFFNLFEDYRQERYLTLKRIRYEQDANWKSSGITERAVDDTRAEIDTHRAALSEHMRNIYSNPEVNERSNP